MKLHKTGIILIVLLMNSFYIRSQSDSLSGNDMIKLYNGFVLKCSITNVSDSGVHLVNKKGEKMFFHHQDFKVIKQDKESIAAMREEKLYFDHDRMLLGQLSMGVGLGRVSNTVINCRTFEGTIKMRLKKKIGSHYLRFNLGRTGYEAIQPFSMWHYGTGYEVVFFDKKASPYVFANVGSSFGLDLLDDNQVVNYKYKGKGGTNYEVGAGVLFRSSYGYAMTISASLFDQPAMIELDYNPLWEQKTIFDLTLRRSLFKIGFVF